MICLRQNVYFLIIIITHTHTKKGLHTSTSLNITYLPHDPFNDASSAPSFVPFQALDQLCREDSGLDLDFDIFSFYSNPFTNSFILFERRSQFAVVFFFFLKASSLFT